jgi:hypothetical protein
MTRSRQKLLRGRSVKAKRAFPFANLLLLRDRAPQVAGRFLVCHPRCCGLHIAHDDRLGARYRRCVNFDFNGAITQLARERAHPRISR